MAPRANSAHGGHSTRDAPVLVPHLRIRPHLVPRTAFFSPANLKQVAQQPLELFGDLATRDERGARRGVREVERREGFLRYGWGGTGGGEAGAEECALSSCGWVSSRVGVRVGGARGARTRETASLILWVRSSVLGVFTRAAFPAKSQKTQNRNGEVRPDQLRLESGSRRLGQATHSPRVPLRAPSARPGPSRAG